MTLDTSISVGDLGHISDHQEIAERLLSVADLGATGDGTTDDTAAIQACIAAVIAQGGGTVYFPPGTYLITSTLTCGTSGVRFAGAGRFVSVIKQSTASENGMTLSRDSTNSFTRGLTFERLTFEGPGDGTSTATGLKATDDTTYQGQSIVLSEVTFKGWQTGWHSKKWDNIDGRMVGLDRCGTGAKIEGNANSVHIQYYGTTCSTVVMHIEDGSAVILRPLDVINSAQMLKLGAQSRVLYIGGNHETCTGSSAFVDCPASADLTMINPRFIKGSGGNDVPGVLVGLARLVIINPSYDGFSTKKVVKKSTTSAIVYFLGASESLSVDPFLVDDGGSVATAGNPFVTRFENSVPAAAEAVRGMLLYETVRDSISDQDDLHFYVKDRSAGSDAYSRRTLTNIISGTGDPESAVAARVGTMFLRTDGGTTSTLYVKESGTGSTGWTAK